MKITIAPDSFKNCLSAKAVAHHLAIGIQSVIANAEIFEIPVADGGEGTLDALVTATDGKFHWVNVKDPLMRDIRARIGLLNNNLAIIEMAEASGLERLQPEEYNPMSATTYGTGQLINAAIELGATEIIVAVGGSATNDGGAGMAQALGAKLKDADGNELMPGAEALPALHTIDLSAIRKKIAGIDVKVAVDVKNPLLGPNGATTVYGMQKGASEAMIPLLEKNLLHYAEVLEKALNINVRDLSGGGAAGGLAAGLVAFLNARIVPGFEVVSKITKLESFISKSDLVITAEGRMDGQTRFGKTPYGVAQTAAKYGKPVFGFAGMLGGGYEILLNEGFSSLYPIAPGPLSLETSIAQAPRLLQQAAARMARTLLAGRNLTC
jgi:glycerate 2-kinase